MIVKARAPLRIGLAGGGTDISSYCDAYGGQVLNVTIDRYAYTVIKKNLTDMVCFSAKDRNCQETIALSAPMTLDGDLKLHKGVYQYIVKNFNDGNPMALEISTYCDAPIGSGLGASSTLVVSMIRAFVEWLNLPLDDYGIAKAAYQVERIDCALAGGKQDQYSATFGGFNFMEFRANNEVLVSPLRIKNWIVCELESSLLLYFTGVSRESANIITEQSNSLQSSKVKALEALHAVKQEASDMREHVLRGNFDGFVQSMREGWKNKKKSATTVSNPYIDEIYDTAIRAGALAGKVSGAGGGGFMLFFVPSEKRMDVIRSLAKFDGEIRHCHFTKEGCQSWHI